MCVVDYLFRSIKQKKDVNAICIDNMSEVICFETLCKSQKRIENLLKLKKHDEAGLYLYAIEYFMKKINTDYKNENNIKSKLMQIIQHTKEAFDVPLGCELLVSNTIWTISNIEELINTA